MPFAGEYSDAEPSRAEIDCTAGAVLLEFGASWCSHCLALAPALARLLTEYPRVQHIRIADGRGKPLGRSFQVKLWPTLIFLQDGEVLARLVRPGEQEVRQAIRQFPPG